MQAGRTRVSILSMLKERDMHGYQIMSEIRERSAGLLAPTAGTIYPILLELEKHGHVSSRWEASRGRRKRKIYHLTTKGSKTVSGIEALRQRMEKGVKEGLTETARMLEIEPEEIPKLGSGRGIGAWFPDFKEVKSTLSKEEKINALKKLREQIRQRIAFMQERERALSKAIMTLS